MGVPVGCGTVLILIADGFQCVGYGIVFQVFHFLRTNDIRKLFANHSQKCDGIVCIRLPVSLLSVETVQVIGHNLELVGRRALFGLGRLLGATNLYEKRNHAATQKYGNQRDKKFPPLEEKPQEGT